MSWKEHKKARNSGGNSSNQLVTKARNEPATNTDHIELVVVISYNNY